MIVLYHETTLRLEQPLACVGGKIWTLPCDRYRGGLYKWQYHG